MSSVKCFEHGYETPLLVEAIGDCLFKRDKAAPVRRQHRDRWFGFKKIAKLDGVFFLIMVELTIFGVEGVAALGPHGVINIGELLDQVGDPDSGGVSCVLGR